MPAASFSRANRNLRLARTPTLSRSRLRGSQRRSVDGRDQRLARPKTKNEPQVRMGRQRVLGFPKHGRRWAAWWLPFARWLPRRRGRFSLWRADCAYDMRYAPLGCRSKQLTGSSGGRVARVCFGSCVRRCTTSGASRFGNLCFKGHNAESLADRDRKERATLYGHTGAVNAVAITPDGKFAVSGSSDKAAKMWSLAKWLAA